MLKNASCKYACTDRYFLNNFEKLKNDNFKYLSK